MELERIFLIEWEKQTRTRCQPLPSSGPPSSTRLGNEGVGPTSSLSCLPFSCPLWSMLRESWVQIPELPLFSEWWTNHFNLSGSQFPLWIMGIIVESVLQDYWVLFLLCCVTLGFYRWIHTWGKDDSSSGLHCFSVCFAIDSQWNDLEEQWGRSLPILS